MTDDHHVPARNDRRLASAGDEYVEYDDARTAWLEANRRRYRHGTPCGCLARDEEPGPWHESKCDMWIPFAPSKNGGNDER